MGSAICEHCHGELPESTQRRRFCSSKCRAAAWQQQRQAKEDRLRELVRRLAAEVGLRAEDFASR